MNKKLIQLIKESKLVIIIGTIGSGKSLLLSKLANHPQLLGKITTNKEQLTFLPFQSNVFVDESADDKHQLMKEIYEQGRVIYCCTNLEKLWIEVRKDAGLIIRTKGVKQRWWFGWEKYLQLTVYPNSRWANYHSKIINLPLTKQDLIRLDIYSNNQRAWYHQTRKESELTNHA